MTRTSAPDPESLTAAGMPVGSLYPFATASHDGVACARVPCSGCPLCAPERRAAMDAITKARASTDDIADLVRAEVLRLAPQCGVDPTELAARPCTRTWWEWLALSMRSGGDAQRPLPMARAHHDIANACVHASEGHYGTAAGMLAMASGETLDVWRDRVRAGMGGGR